MALHVKAAKSENVGKQPNEARGEMEARQKGSHEGKGDAGKCIPHIKENRLGTCTSGTMTGQRFQKLECGAGRGVPGSTSKLGWGEE